jgi:hypothetical protein
MVTTHFIGRLGNSMFQTAACIGYAKKYGYRWGVPNDQRESTILTHFPNLPRCNDRHRRYLEHQPGHDNDWFNYHEIPDHGPDTTLFGFYQSWKYFENARDEVKQAFKLQQHDIHKGKISIHVRRGDYLQHSNSFPPVDMEFLGKAMEFFPDKKFLVFSDDINWCRINIGLSENVEFSSEANEFKALSEMGSCDGHIIANSSFSWWGAYLGHNPLKTVIAPSCVRGNWFGLESGVKQDCVDLLPPEWVQIKFR